MLTIYHHAYGKGNLPDEGGVSDQRTCALRAIQLFDSTLTTAQNEKMESERRRIAGSG